MDQTYRQQTLDNLARFRDFTSTRETFLVKGDAPAVGSTFRNPDLAATYGRIADGGGKAFYSGQTAAAEPTRRGGGSALVQFGRVGN